MAAIRLPYLGRPENMIVLPTPTSPIEATSSRGEAVSQLASGGTAVATRLDEKRTWPLTYEFLPASDADVLRGFYLRLFGLGPFVFVDPTVRNVLPLDVSTCGIRAQAAHGWTVSSGSLTRTTGGPTGLNMSGVLSWSGFAASATIVPAFATTTAPVALTAEACTVSMWVKGSSAFGATLRIIGYDATGTVVSTSPSQTVAVSTSWQVFSVTAAVGALLTPLFALPRLALPGSGLPASVQIAGVQVEYGDTRTAWQPGNGSPRVNLSAPVGRSVQKVEPLPTGRGAITSHTFTLAEV